jgi:transposase
MGMTFRIRSIRLEREKFDLWLADNLSRKPSRLASVIMANKTARMNSAVMTPNEPYKVRTV